MALGFGFEPTQSIEMSMNCRSPINNLSANQRPVKRLFGPPLALCIFGIERALVVFVRHLILVIQKPIDGRFMSHCPVSYTHLTLPTSPKV